MRYLLVLIVVGSAFWGTAQENVKVKQGDKAVNFSLKTIDGEQVHLGQLNVDSRIVLVVLRGWPEYQCPICSKQVGQFISKAEKFQKLESKVLMVYPGPSNVIKEKAQEFSGDFIFPDNFFFMLDPDYSMINKYGLRWDAPRETAYPSTFIIDKMGKIVYSNVSSTHGGRSRADEILDILEKF